jgi:transcriptional regulator with XRE-family HTH domain
MTDLDHAIARFYIEVGRRVRDARIKARPKMTQVQLADALSMTRSSIANLEAGRQRIPLHVLVWIAEVLDVQPPSLLPDQSMFGELVVVPDLTSHLAEVPDGMRDFVQGTIAKLTVSSKRGHSGGAVED